MAYLELLQEMLTGFEDYYQQVMNGDFSQVSYLEGHDEKYGTYDLHDTNRLKLAYYLRYCQNAPENILIRLFQEECIQLETNDFQGIGETIKMLTALFSEDHQELFDRAKNANFDCYCGYEPEFFRRMSRNPADLTVEACLDIAYGTGERQYAQQFLDIFTAEFHPKNRYDCSGLIWWNEQFGRSQENETLFRKILEFSLDENDPDEIISARQDLCEFLIKQERFPEAYQEFLPLSEMDLSDWYGVNLFRFILEDCLDLINADLPEAPTIWKWAKHHIKREIKNRYGMYGDFYEKLILASQKMNPRFVHQVQKYYKLWKKRNKIPETS